MPPYFGVTMETTSRPSRLLLGNWTILPSYSVAGWLLPQQYDILLSHIRGGQQSVCPEDLRKARSVVYGESCINVPTGAKGGVMLV